MKRALSVVLMVAILACGFAMPLTANADTIGPDKTNATLMGTTQNDGADRSSWLSGTLNVVNQMGYNTGAYPNVDRATALSALKSKEIWAIHAHGYKAGVRFDYDNSWISYNDISSLSRYALSKEKVVIFGTCNAGEGGSTGNNMVNITYNRGASTVIGFQDATYTSQINRWLYEFFVGSNQGKNIYDACSQADYWTKFYHLGIDGGTGNRLIRGSTSAHLKQ